MFTAKLDRLEISQKRFISDPFNFYSLGFAVLLNIIHWSYLYYKMGHATGTIILHYNLVSGPDLVDKVKYAYAIPATALILLVVNTLLANYFYRKEKLAAYFLNFSGIALQLIFLAATLTVIYING